MNISRPFIRRPIGTTLMAIGLFLVGAVAYVFLPVASLPAVELPTIAVSANRPGASPNTMAATVAAPLERRLAEISGVNELTSVSSLGNTRITVQFDLSRTSTAPPATCRPPSTPRSATCPPTCRRCRPSANPIRRRRPS